jgi:uncharacterized membrane protein YfcA
VGGGILVVPILSGPFKLTQHQAHGTSLAAIGATALVSVVVYGLHGNVAWGTAAIVALASLVAAPLGARLAARTSAKHLLRAFAVLMLVVAVRMWFTLPSAPSPAIAGGAARVAVDLAVGVGVGLLSGLMGVGGGLIAVPAFTLLFGMNQQLAQGTSLAVILVAAPAGAIEHARHGNVVGRLVPWLAIGAAIGGPLASLVAQGLPQALLARLFSVFLLVNGVRSLMRSYRA